MSKNIKQCICHLPFETKRLSFSALRKYTVVKLWLGDKFKMCCIMGAFFDFFSKYWLIFYYRLNILSTSFMIPIIFCHFRGVAIVKAYLNLLSERIYIFYDGWICIFNHRSTKTSGWLSHSNITAQFYCWLPQKCVQQSEQFSCTHFALVGDLTWIHDLFNYNTNNPKYKIK